MTDDVLSNSSLEQISIPPLGEVFVIARNSKNLTQKDVSNNLRLSVKQINALENNEFSSLPQPMITRGFIRNYARLLELDAEPLLESYRMRMPETLPSTLSVQTSTHQIMLNKNSQPWLKYILGSILVLLFLLAWFFYIEYMPVSVKQPIKNTADLASKNDAATFTPLPEIALPAAERLPESLAVEAETIVAEPVDANASLSGDAVQATPTEKNKTITNDIVMPVQNGTPTQAMPLKPPTDVDFKTLKDNAAKNTQVTLPQSAVTVKPVDAIANVAGIAKTSGVSMSVTEQTWVRVTDKSGNVIYEKMLAANSSDSFEAKPPLSLLIGNAKATTLTFLSKPVDLTGNTKNNVARITLE